MIYDVSILIGRFQPLHNAHMRVIHYGLAISNHIIFVLGSCQKNDEPSFLKKNPFSVEERMMMIREAVGKSECRKITIFESYDYLNDNDWYNAVNTSLLPHVKNKSCVLLGGNKEEEYFEYFHSTWKKAPPLDFIEKINATDIREKYFHNLWVGDLIPYNVSEYLNFLKYSRRDWFDKMKELYVSTIS